MNATEEPVDHEEAKKFVEAKLSESKIDHQVIKGKNQGNTVRSSCNA
jgi:hypothetical protein